MASVGVLVPVLARPGQVARFNDSLASSELPGGATLIPWFICSPNDQDEVAAVRAAGWEPIFVDWPAGPGDFARKVNHAYEQLSLYAWFFFCGDDVAFCPGWADAALREAGRTGAHVIGTNDLGNPQVVKGDHATHVVFSRSYIETRGGVIDDEPGVVLCEAYDHNFVDNEFVETAKARGEWAFAGAAHVEHCHPHWTKGDWDETYRKGQAHFAQDRTLYQTRRKLWS